MSEVLGRPKWCSSCEDRRIYSPDQFGDWRCLVCQNRDAFPSARSGSPDGPAVTAAGPSPTRCKFCRLGGARRPHPCIDRSRSGTAADGGEGCAGPSPRHPSSGGGASASTYPVNRDGTRPVTDGPHRFFDGGDAA